jgi:hypothetical protein
LQVSYHNRLVLVAMFLVVNVLCYHSIAGNLNTPPNRSYDNGEMYDELSDLKTSTSNSSNSTSEMMSTKDQSLPRDAPHDQGRLYPVEYFTPERRTNAGGTRDSPNDNLPRGPGCQPQQPLDVGSNHDARSTSSSGRQFSLQSAQIELTEAVISCRK